MFSSRFFSLSVSFFFVFFGNVDGNSGRLLGPDNLDRIPDVRHFGCTKGTFVWLHGNNQILANL